MRKNRQRLSNHFRRSGSGLASLQHRKARVFELSDQQTGPIRHQLELGVRLHHARIERRQVHSLRAPAVGYRIRAGKVRVFYVPDVLELPGRPGALAGITLYRPKRRSNSVAARLRALGRARGVSVELARDGWTRSVAL